MIKKMMKAHIQKRKNKPQSNLDFKMMSLCFSIRDIFKDPIKKVEKSRLKSGDYVIDYACGTGSYSLAAAEVIGPSGKVYAADIHPLAIKKVKRRVAKKGLTNVDTILTDCATGLEDNSIDAIICFDALHAFGNLKNNLREFHRVLKPDAIFTVDDHHYEKEKIVSMIQENGMFKLLEIEENIFNFINLNSTSQ
jgi:ubiquinone/menaquinone biosynthesis C-methylase UbiE